MAGDFPSEGMELTLLLVVSDIERSTRFYRDVLGATLYREYGGTSSVFRFQGTWLLLVTGGGSTEDRTGRGVRPSCGSQSSDPRAHHSSPRLLGGL